MKTFTLDVVSSLVWEYTVEVEAETAEQAEELFRGDPSRYRVRIQGEDGHVPWSQGGLLASPYTKWNHSPKCWLNKHGNMCLICPTAKIEERFPGPADYNAEPCLSCEWLPESESDSEQEEK